VVGGGGKKKKTRRETLNLKTKRESANPSRTNMKGEGASMEKGSGGRRKRVSNSHG